MKVVFLAMLLAAGGAAFAQPAAPAKIVVTGSSTMAPLVAELAKRFMQRHPGVSIVVEAGGSGRGLADACAGKADIGMASRELNSEEKRDLFAITIARDGVAFVVHRDNPVRAISREQIVAIYRGQVANWKALGGRDAPIHAVTRTPGHSTLEIVSDYLGMKPQEIKAQPAAGDNPEPLNHVLTDPHALAFMSFGLALDAMQSGRPVAPLAVGGVAATAGELRAGRYPLGRPLHLVTRSVPGGAVRAFIEYAQSPAARAVIEEHDFVPFL